MFDHFKAAWPIVKANLVGWMIFAIVMAIVLSFGIGIFLMPNCHRAVRNAIVRQEAPAIGDIFNFDNIGADLAIMLTFIVAMVIGYMLCIIPGIIAAFGLFWMPFLAAEGKFAAIDAAKASFGHAKSNIVPIILFLIVSSVLNQIGGVACGIGALITMPITFVAMWLFFESQRDAIYAGAQAAGIPMKS
jgi:uncharacterized membrane protein